MCDTHSYGQVRILDIIALTTQLKHTSKCTATEPLAWSLPAQSCHYWAFDPGGHATAQGVAPSMPGHQHMVRSQHTQEHWEDDVERDTEVEETRLAFAAVRPPVPLGGRLQRRGKRIS